MLLALVVPLLLVASCSGSSRSEPPSPPDRPSQTTGAASSAPQVSVAPGATWAPSLPAPPLPPGRLVVVEPAGALCVLDSASGALLSRQENQAMDVIADRSGPGRLVTVEPALSGQETPGRLGRYELRGDRLELRSSLPFDAPEGVLLDAEVSIVGLSLSEGTTLFQATTGGGSGRSWGAVSAYATRPAGTGSLALLTAGFPDGKFMELKYTTVNAQGVAKEEHRQGDPGDCGVAVFEGEGAFGVVRTAHERVQIAWPGRSLDGAEVDAPGACVRGVRWLGSKRGLAVVTGPTPLLWLVRQEGSTRVELGDGLLSESSLPLRELVLDAARGRLWVPVGKVLRGVDLEEERVVAEGACKAVQAALIEPLAW